LIEPDALVAHFRPEAAEVSLALSKIATGGARPPLPRNRGHAKLTSNATGSASPTQTSAVNVPLVRMTDKNNVFGICSNANGTCGSYPTN
jgi:hypothetical protein